MKFKTLSIAYKMLQERVADLEQERVEEYEDMQMWEGFYETAVENGDIEAQQEKAQELEAMNKEYEKIQKELKEKKEALREIENAELV